MTDGPSAGNDHVVSLLDRYRTGELRDEQRRRVETHLEVCADCMAALADLAAFVSTVEKGYDAERALGAESEPDWAQVRQEIVARTSAVDAQSRRGWLVRHLPQTAAAVVAVLAAVVVVQQGVRGPEDVSRALRPGQESERAEVGGPEALPPASEPRSSEVDALGALESETEAVERSPDESELRQLEDEPAGISDGRAVDLNAGRQGRKEGFDEVDRADDLRENQIAANREIPAVGEVEHAAAPPPPDEEEVSKDGYYKRKPAAGEDGKVAEGEAAVVTEKLEAEVEPEARALSRFETRARYAIAESDTLAATAALEFWNDSLGAGVDLEPVELERAQALADSLVSLLAGRP